MTPAIRQILVVAAFVLSGCPTYWVKSEPAREVVGVVDVDDVVGWCGYIEAPPGTILIRYGCVLPQPEKKAIVVQAKGLPSEVYNCALEHHLSEAQGWRHDPSWHPMRLDCGPQ